MSFVLTFSMSLWPDCSYKTEELQTLDGFRSYTNRMRRGIICRVMYGRSLYEPIRTMDKTQRSGNADWSVSNLGEDVESPCTRVFCKSNLS